MRHQAICLATSAALLCIAPAQEEAADKHLGTAEMHLQELREDLEGAWRLTSFFDPTGVVDPNDFEGYALFVDGFMSLEMHVVAPGIEDSNPMDFIVTGTHRLRFHEGDVMELLLLIGASSFTADDSVQFEQSGTRRKYRVKLTGDSLRLERVDGHEVRGTRFNFERVRGDSRDKRDIYGRELDKDGKRRR